MKKSLLTYLLFCFSYAVHAQQNTPPLNSGPVGIGTQTPLPSFSLHVVGQSRYEGAAVFGDYYDPVIYSKGIQITRPTDQGDNAFHLSFIRAGRSVTGMGYLRNSNIFAIQTGADNTAGYGIFIGQNVGINVPSPQYPLDVAGNIRFSGQRLLLNSYGVMYADQNNVAIFTDGGYVFGNKDNTQARAIIESNGSLNLYSAGSVVTRFATTGSSFIKTGSLAIGGIDPGSYKLAVDGTIGARKIKVTQGAWADFVFDSDYKLPSLSEIEAHTKLNKHLPGIPSAKEIAQEGLDIGDMQQRQMQKIEELTLYLIDQNKKLEQQQQLILELTNRLNELEKKQSK